VARRNTCGWPECIINGTSRTNTAVATLGLRREFSDRHVFDHAPAQRAYCFTQFN
jgi:hypothetical protein